MKKWTQWMALALMVFMIAGGQALAAKGTCQAGKNNTQTQGQMANGPADRPCAIIANGEPVTVTGTVYAALYAGQGLTVDTGDELITVYGFGPQWYWDQLGVEKPAVGETVTINGLKITFVDGTEKIIALSITIGEDVVQLRDENGRPLWRGRGMR